MILAILGMYPFCMNTIPYQSIDRSHTWRHPNQSVVGGYAPSQYTGREPEEITINAELRPEITGGDKSINNLKAMAETGQPHTLILGTGELLGSFVILSIQEKRSKLMYDGKARAISFTMTLRKVSEQSFGLDGQALGIAIGMVRAITGI